jgi:hypothetical protein
MLPQPLQLFALPQSLHGNDYLDTPTLQWANQEFTVTHTSQKHHGFDSSRFGEQLRQYLLRPGSAGGDSEPV